MDKHSLMSSFARPLLVLTIILVQSRMLPPLYGQEEMREEALSLPLLGLCELVFVNLLPAEPPFVLSFLSDKFAVASIATVAPTARL